MPHHGGPDYLLMQVASQVWQAEKQRSVRMYTYSARDCTCTGIHSPSSHRDVVWSSTGMSIVTEESPTLPPAKTTKSRPTAAFNIAVSLMSSHRCRMIANKARKVNISFFCCFFVCTTAALWCFLLFVRHPADLLFCALQFTLGRISAT